jgi:hypothetical protein
MKRYTGPPTTLGNAAAAKVRVIVWCRDCQHRVEPDPAEHAARYGAELPVIDWVKRLKWRLLVGQGPRALTIPGQDPRR